MKATLCLTHNCNLRCSYCYAGGSQGRDMSAETAKQCVDFALGSLRAGETLDLCLFGGEPLLRLDLAREISAYSLRKAAAEGKSLRITMTTNGTLVTQEALDFAREHDVSVCFSVDGPPQIHDRKRRYRDGGGTLADVMRGVEQALKQLDSVEVNAVFGPREVDELPATLQFFLDAGVSAIHLNPDIMAGWPDDLSLRVNEAYLEVARLYAEAYRQGREIAVNLIDSKAILFIKGGYGPEDRCGMGIREWGFAPSGNIYPCERFIGDDTNTMFRLGNIHTGLESVHRCAMGLKRGNSNPGCSKCRVKQYCMNWCGCTNYLMSGYTDIAAPALCAMEKAAIKAADWAFKTLVEADNQTFIDHMFAYGGGHQQASLKR